MRGRLTMASLGYWGILRVCLIHFWPSLTLLQLDLSIHVYVAFSHIMCKLRLSFLNAYRLLFLSTESYRLHLNNTVSCILGLTRLSCQKLIDRNHYALRKTRRHTQSTKETCLSRYTRYQYIHASSACSSTDNWSIGYGTDG